MLFLGMLVPLRETVKRGFIVFLNQGKINWIWVSQTVLYHYRFPGLEKTKWVEYILQLKQHMKHDKVPWWDSQVNSRKTWTWICHHYFLCTPLPAKKSNFLVKPNGNQDVHYRLFMQFIIHIKITSFFPSFILYFDQILSEKTKKKGEGLFTLTKCLSTYYRKVKLLQKKGLGPSWVFHKNMFDHKELGSLLAL